MTNKERREYYKKQHRCIICCSKDERTLLGFTTCEKCAAKQRAYGRKYYKKRNAKARERRLRRIQNHLCVTCGTKLPDDSEFKNCVTCRKKIADYQRKTYGSVRYER